MALIVVASAAALLIVAQLVLPPLAASHLRSTLSRNGRVLSVHVSAFPAIKLLFGHADSVRIRMTSLSATPARGGDLLASASRTQRLEVQIDRLTVGPLLLRNAELHKRGRQLDAAAVLTRSDLAAALPPGLAVQPVASGDGALVLRATALGLFSGDAAVAARGGRLLLVPNVPFGGLFSLTLFGDPRIDITGVGARALPDGYALDAAARLTS